MTNYSNGKWLTYLSLQGLHGYTGERGAKGEKGDEVRTALLFLSLTTVNKNEFLYNTEFEKNDHK